jgi:hypothetical protein
MTEKYVHKDLGYVLMSCQLDPEHREEMAAHTPRLTHQFMIRNSSGARNCYRSSTYRKSVVMLIHRAEEEETRETPPSEKGAG